MKNPRFLLLTLFLIPAFLMPPIDLQAQTTYPTTRKVIKKPVKKRVPVRKKRVYSELFGIKGRWYIGGMAGSISQERVVTARPTVSGLGIYYNGTYLGPSEVGTNYEITDKETLTRKQIHAGFQRLNDGDFFELGYYDAETLEEIYIAYGWTWPSLSFDRKWLIPYMKFDVGIGYAESTNLSPTSNAYGLWLGGYTWWLGRNFRTRYEIGYAQRDWLDIDTNYGKEAWEDEEYRLQLGVDWVF